MNTNVSDNRVKPSDLEFHFVHRTLEYSGISFIDVRCFESNGVVCCTFYLVPWVDLRFDFLSEVTQWIDSYCSAQSAKNVSRETLHGEEVRQ